MKNVHEIRGRKYRAISLFSGAMGLDLGVEAAGFDIRLFVDYDKACIETIKANRPNANAVLGDLSVMKSDELLKLSGLKKGEADLIFGGPPCQSFSTAGKMRSFKDPRGSLVLNYVRFINEIRPTAFIFENVKQFKFISTEATPTGAGVSRTTFDYVKKKFESYGYALTCGIFNAADYGVPQKRERLFIIGTLRRPGVIPPAPTHSEDGSIGKRWLTLGEAIRNIKNNSEGETHKGDRMKYLKLIPAGGNWKSLPPKLQKEAMGKKLKLGGGKTGFFRRLSMDKPAPTLCTSPTHPGTNMCHPTELRPLSINEYKALQQFPKSWKFVGSIAQKYRQIGNAVPVGLAYAMANSVKDNLDGKVSGLQKYFAEKEPVKARATQSTILTHRAVRN